MPLKTNTRARNISPLLAVSLGCPAGIGPEVALWAARKLSGTPVLLVGDVAVVRRAAAGKVAARRILAVGSRCEAMAAPAGSILVWDKSARLGRLPRPGKPTVACGRAQLAWVDRACDLVAGGVCDALVTGPVSKAAIVRGGLPEFRGHTEHLGRRLKAKEVVMSFASPKLLVSLATTHLPLAEVPQRLTPGAVASACFWAANMVHRLRQAQPRIVVAGLNPHAGEGGLLGREEKDCIRPGVQRARRRLKRAGIDAELVGPIGAETAFRKAVDGHFHGVVAMYHDQATIPCKLLGFGDAVNVTLGLPIVRTSVDHGTGYDIAGSGRAEGRGMLEAMRLALRLCEGAA